MACTVNKYILINLNHYIFMGFSISVCLKLYKYLKTGREWIKQMGKDYSFELRKMREKHDDFSLNQEISESVIWSFHWFPCLDFMASGAGKALPLFAGIMSCCFDIQVSPLYKLEKHFSKACLGRRPESSDASSVLTRQGRIKKKKKNCLPLHAVRVNTRLQEGIKHRNTSWPP